MAQYATVSDLTSIGLPATALGQMTLTQQNDALEEASREVDARLTGRYGVGRLPFITWDSIITGITARIAVYHILTVRGYNPAAGSDINIQNRYTIALRDCELIQKQQLHPVITLQAMTTTFDQPVVLSSSVVNLQTGAPGVNRGW